MLRLPLLLIVTAALALPAGAFAATGGLTQLSGADGCVSDDGTSGTTADPTCADGRALAGASAVAVSPDGANVYAVANRGSGPDAIDVFARNSSTGALTQLAGADGCLVSAAAEGCTVAHAIDNPGAIVISPDGKNVYVIGVPDAAKGTIAIFDRDAATGKLTQKSGTDGCFTNFGDMACRATTKPLAFPLGEAISPDGTSLYVATIISNTVVGFQRHADGTLEEANCVSNAVTTGCTDVRALGGPRALAVTADGKSVYAAAQSSDSIVTLGRASDGTLTQPADAAGCISNSGAESCATGRGLHTPLTVAVGPGGKQVYATSNADSALVTLTRDATSGALTQSGDDSACRSGSGAVQHCVEDDHLGTPPSIALSSDGANLYAANSNGANVGEYSLAGGTGLLNPLPSPQACIQQPGAGQGDCTDGKALWTPNSVAVSPDGRNVYSTVDFGGTATLPAVNGVDVFRRELPPVPQPPAGGPPSHTPAGNPGGGTNATPPPPSHGRCLNAINGDRRANVLTGTRYGDVIRGFAGNDTLRGLGGADCLVGGPGRDRIFGGAGNDTIDARDGSADRIDCGPGRDVVKADRKDRVTGCEKVLRPRRRSRRR